MEQIDQVLQLHCRHKNGQLRPPLGIFYAHGLVLEGVWADLALPLIFMEG